MRELEPYHTTTLPKRVRWFDTEREAVEAMLQWKHDPNRWPGWRHFGKQWTGTGHTHPSGVLETRWRGWASTCTAALPHYLAKEE